MRRTSHFIFFKKLCLLGSAFLVMVSCAKQPTPQWSSERVALANASVILPEQQSAQSFGTTTRVALLLPLTGNSAAIGETLRNASTMAQFDAPNTQTELSFFDTKGTAEGAVQAYHKALEFYPNLIIGPVFSAEVKVVAKENPRVPVLSFSSDTDVLESGIYSLALLIPQQVERVVDFACQSGKTSLAVVGPENKVGRIAMNALDEALKKCPSLRLTKTALYPSDTVNFDPVLKRILPAEIKKTTQKLTPQEQQQLQRELSSKISFDSLFIFAEGSGLTQILSLLSFYDITPKIVDMYTLTSTQYGQENVYKGIYFPALNEKYYRRFEQTYQRNFGKSPNRLGTMGYDAVSLASFLGQTGDVKERDLTGEKGFTGIDGLFRLNPNGTNERALGIMRFRYPGVFEEVSPAPTEFQPRSFWASKDHLNREKISDDLVATESVSDEDLESQVEAE